MGWIIALIVGGVAGWLANIVMGRSASMGIFLNIVVGCVGSVIGNWLSGQLPLPRRQMRVLAPGAMGTYDAGFDVTT